jgi:hypothetical protein
MCSAVLVLSLLAAVDPVRIGITALLISRPRPMRNLLAFWAGGMAAGIGAALGLVLYLRVFTLSVLAVVESASSGLVGVYIQVALGLLAVSFAGLLIGRYRARRRASMSMAAGGASVLGADSATPTTSGPTASGPTTPGRLSVRRQLEGGSWVAAFVAGVALATPPVEYLAAIVAIMGSEPSTPAQVGSAIMFTVVAFTVVEVPLVTYLTAPAQTMAVVGRMNEWLTERRQAIPGVIVGALGFLLLVSGVGKV